MNKFPNFQLKEFLYERSIEHRLHDSDGHVEIALDCPQCMKRGEPSPDTKKRLWVNEEKGTYYCYRCQWAGNMLYLVQGLANTNAFGAVRILAGKINSSDPFEFLDLKLEVEEFQGEENNELKEIELPYGYKSLKAQHPYLEKRGVPFEYARKHRWGISDAGHTKGRIIVPTFMDGKLVFWQARATWESAEKDFKKVLNPTGISARKILYNFDVAKEYKEIILVEGFMDAVKVGPDAMATNGKTLHTSQIENLLALGIKKIVIMWDRDTWHDTKGKKPCSIQKGIDLLRLYDFEVRAVKLPAKRDPGSFCYQSRLLRDLIKDAKVPIF